MAVSDTQDGFYITGASTTQGPFHLLGGVYSALCTATFSAGNVHLQVLAADGATYVDVGASTNFTAAGYVGGLFLPGGVYQVKITTSTAVQFALTHVATDRT